MSNSFSPLKSVGCSITKHKFKTSRIVNDRVEELCCTKCGKQMTKTIYGDFVPLNDRYEQINRALNDVAQKRKSAGLVTA